MRRAALSLLPIVSLLLAACPSSPECVPTCGSKVCGDDGCGGVCGICGEAFECLEGACSLKPTCTDGLANGDEGDVDCGGSACAPCVDGKQCKAGDDCASGRCEEGTCSSCEDGIRNGGEADVDCGAECAACEDGKSCAVPGDCASGKCSEARCISCGDGVTNGTESDVDCGGDCTPCRQGAACSAHSDCASRTCISAVCEDPTCTDGVLNQSETDLDCGGEECGQCALGKSCAEHDDCLDGACWQQVCGSAECRVQRDCGDVVANWEAALCLDRRCEPPCEPYTTKVVTIQARFGNVFVAGTKPKTVVVRFIHPYKIDGTPVSCAEVRTLGGDTQATRNQIDYDRGLNIVYRTFFQPEWIPNQSFYLKEMTIPRASEPVIVYGEAWYGDNEANNPTGRRAALDCIDGVDIGALAGDARLTFTFNPP